MKANAVTLLAIFEKKMRLEIPLFQRQYVWSLDEQWEPLWEDIQRKFIEFLSGRKDGPIHFLGAMVLDQKQTPTTHVEKRLVIDGQQRLTTLQIFLAAFRDFCAEQQCAELAKECDSFTQNKGMMASPEVERFKVWPTQLDREQFADVLMAGSKDKLEVKYPLKKKKYARKFEARPRMVEAYVFFYGKLVEFFLGTESEPALYTDQPIDIRAEECFQALKNALQVVVIDLEQGDDAQVIFETLNARGEPLLPADLVRNYVFLRASRQGEDQEKLYQEHWRNFDDPFWAAETRQGRLSRPRSDLFLQHFLASRLATDIPIRHLFVEYKYWIEQGKPYTSVREELAAVNRHGLAFRRMLEPNTADVLYPLSKFLEIFDMSTAYPLLLSLVDSKLTPEQWATLGDILESYILRRAVCGLTTKNYNRVFLGLIKSLQKEPFTINAVRKYLSELPGDSTMWPNDTAFKAAWTTRNLYSALSAGQRLVHLLKRLNDTYLTTKQEPLIINGPLTVEHILPQQWVDHWPLQSGKAGLNAEHIGEEPDSDESRESLLRHATVQTIGNLTIITQPLNSSVSNSSWKVKKPALLAASLLPINQQLHQHDEWDEKSISQRSDELFEIALKVWPGPGQQVDIEKP